MAADNRSEQALVRDERGRFVRGSGNPHGRPSVIREVRGLARQHTEAAVAVLVSIAGDRKAPPAARVSAAQALLDRAWGRPEQAVALVGDGIRDLPEDFVPADGIGAAMLYEQITAGLVTPESALVALDRAIAGAASNGAQATTLDAPAAPQPSPLAVAPPPPKVSAHPLDERPASPTSVGQERLPEAPSTPVVTPANHPTTPWIAPTADALHDSTGCPTAAGLLAAQRAREAAIARDRAEGEAVAAASKARAAAEAAERARQMQPALDRALQVLLQPAEELESP